MRRAGLAFVVIAGAAAVAGCGPDLPERYWRSEHVRYFSRAADTSVCPAILDEIEEHGAVIADALLIERTVTTYYKFTDQNDFEANSGCGDVGLACAQNATARSFDGFDRHELIHAYLAPYGQPPWLLAEGAAVALSCQRYPRPTGTWQEAFAAPHPSTEQYAAGGWLVGYLLHMFPGRLLPRLYKLVPYNATADQFARLVQEIYEMKLDDIWAAAISVPQTPMRCPWECERPAWAADGQPRALEPACGSGGVQLSVDLPAGGVTRWRVEGQGRFQVRSCDGSEEPMGVVTGYGGAGLLVAPLLSGSYFVDAVVDPGGAATLSGSVDGDGEVASFTCASAPALPDDIAALGKLAIFYPGSQSSRFTGFATASDRDSTMSVQSEDPNASATMCLGCDLASCFAAGTIGPGVVISAAPGAALTAHLTWRPRHL